MPYNPTPEEALKEDRSMAAWAKEDARQMAEQLAACDDPEFKEMAAEELREDAEFQRDIRASLRARSRD